MMRLAQAPASGKTAGMSPHRGRAPSAVARASFAAPATSLALGAGALVLAACGEKEATPSSVPIAGDDAGAPQAEPVEPDAAVEPGRSEGLSSEEQAELSLGGPTRTDVVALGVEELLRAYCGGCHGRGENGPGFSGGFDLGELIARGLIVPGSSATSPLVQNLLHEVSAAVRVRRPTAGDIALITQLIDRMRREPLPSCEPLPFLSGDEALAAMLADVVARPEAERPFLRYLGVSYASNAGMCGAALDEQRFALFKLVNSLSTTSQIRVPAAIDPERRLYRIDVRDYGWNRELDLEDDGSIDYTDAWSAIVAVAGASALELAGPEASALSGATGSSVPFLAVNALVNAASLHDLYYALVGVRADLGATQLERGIDLVSSLEAATMRRAGVEREHGNELLASRVPAAGASPGDYWLAEVQTEVRGSSIYIDALGFNFGDWSKSIFRLPNGLMAFSANTGGQRLGQMPRPCFVGDCAAPAYDVAIACQGCHAGGLLPIEDTVRDIVARDARVYPARFVEDVAAIFPTAEEFSALIAEDNARYLAALDAAGVPRDGADPISRVYLQFATDPIDLARAAAELGVTPAALRERLGELPELAALADPAATVSRQTLLGASARALCALGTRNRPATCP